MKRMKMKDKSAESQEPHGTDTNVTIYCLCAGTRIIGATTQLTVAEQLLNEALAAYETLGFAALRSTSIGSGIGTIYRAELKSADADDTECLELHAIPNRCSGLEWTGLKGATQEPMKDCHCANSKILAKLEAVSEQLKEIRSIVSCLKS